MNNKIYHSSVLSRHKNSYRVKGGKFILRLKYIYIFISVKNINKLIEETHLTHKINTQKRPLA